MHALVELLATNALEPIASKVNASRDNADVGPLTERILNHFFVLFHGNRACAVHHVTARCRLGRHAINSAENELFLQLREKDEVALRLVSIHSLC